MGLFITNYPENHIIENDLRKWNHKRKDFYWISLVCSRPTALRKHRASNPHQNILSRALFFWQWKNPRHLSRGEFFFRWTTMKYMQKLCYQIFGRWSSFAGTCSIYFTTTIWSFSIKIECYTIFESLTIFLVRQVNQKI